MPPQGGKGGATAAPPPLVFCYGDRRVTAGSGPNALRSIDHLEQVVMEVEKTLQLPPNSYEFWDDHGKINNSEDLRRVIKSAIAAGMECEIEVREHLQFIEIRDLKGEDRKLHSRIDALEKILSDQEANFDQKIKAAEERLREMIVKLHSQVNNEIVPVIETLCRDRNQLTKEVRLIQEKLGQINIQELREMAEDCKQLRTEVRCCVMRVDKIDSQWNQDKVRIFADLERNFSDLKELQRYMQGKMDVLIEQDADLKREIQLTGERLHMTADDCRLVQEELQRLTMQCAGALEESEELRTLLGQVREDNVHLNANTHAVSTRVHCLEGAALEKWDGFSPGVLYFRRFDIHAKGSDVQLSKDLQIATGRGFLAATGVVMGSDEGLCVGDGPCRRFGTPGQFSSYYELEIDEICAAPEGAGGLYVGFSIQSAWEIAAHPRHEFDGWLMGGPGKALMCRQGVGELAGYDPEALPATFSVGIGEEGVTQTAVRALKTLRTSMPPKSKGEVKELLSFWNSQEVRMGDRVGVLFRCNRDGGARLRVTVDGKVKATHEFLDAPPAEAVGFLTPIIRIAGTGKAIRIFPGLIPPARILAD